MVDTLFFRLLFVLLAGTLPAQIRLDLTDVTAAGQDPSLGAALPAPSWGQWLRGEPVPHGKGGVTVYEFFTRGNAGSLAADVDYLAELQRRFAEQPLSVVAVVTDAVTEVPENVKQCRVVQDAGGATTAGWVGSDPVLVVDGDAQVTWRGRLGYGLVDAIERTLAGKPALQREQQMRLPRSQLVMNFDSMVGAQTKKLVDGLLAHAPRDGEVLALAYLTAATKLRDLEGALAWRASAVDRLANLPRPLAVFADLALRGDPTNRELATQLAAALVPATATAPNDPAVQLAYLRALVLSGKARQVGRRAMTTRKLAFENAADCVTFCEILTQDEMPQVHRDLCEQAIARAEKLSADPRQLAALRYVVARHCAEDEEAAAGVLARYLGSSRDSLNNDCWYFMTQLPTMGRHDRFAAALAEKMLEQREQMDSPEFDTAALAMFLAGRFEAAVELQETAIQTGAQGNAEYIERLERYRAAAAAGKAAETGKK